MAVASRNVDVAIVGAGAAGLNAALVLGRARRRVVVFDAGAPRNAKVAHAYGFLGHDGIAPRELLARGRAEVEPYGVDIVEARVDDVLADADGFALQTAAGTWHARTVVLATGLVDQLPAIEGLDEIWGNTAAECPYCHGWEARDSRIAVVGTTDKLPRVAALLTQWSRDVVLIAAEASRFDPQTQARLDATGVRIVARDPRRFVSRDGRLREIVLDDGTALERDHVFVAMATRAASDLAARVCDVDAKGFALVDPEGRTSRTGIWAVGNASDRIAKLVHAAASGSRAAASINVYLFENDLQAKLSTV